MEFTVDFCKVEEVCASPARMLAQQEGKGTKIKQKRVQDRA